MAKLLLYCHIPFCVRICLRLCISSISLHHHPLSFQATEYMSIYILGPVNSHCIIVSSSNYISMHRHYPHRQTFTVSPYLLWCSHLHTLITNLSLHHIVLSTYLCTCIIKLITLLNCISTSHSLYPSSFIHTIHHLQPPPLPQEIYEYQLSPTKHNYLHSTEIPNPTQNHVHHKWQ